MKIQNTTQHLLGLLFSGMLLLAAAAPTRAQELTPRVDPAGYIQKYDPTFAGIGPQVYLLPTPRSKHQILEDSFLENLSFQSTIADALTRQALQREMMPLPTLNQHKAAAAAAATWDSLYSIHAQALAWVGENEVVKAIPQLEQCLQLAQQGAFPTEIIRVLRNNLANAYLFNKQLLQAGALQEALYAEAVANKNSAAQGMALIKIAHIQADDNDYSSAQNTIIRRAIPLFNKTKNYAAKVTAWTELAKIYQQQNKHTEAQWFLIQARDIATLHKLIDVHAEIEYMLAFSKYIQKNYGVAQQELLRADTLALQENNDLLRLAIQDKLGQIYIHQKNYNKAERTLQQYQQLKALFFKS